MIVAPVNASAGTPVIIMSNTVTLPKDTNLADLRSSLPDSLEVVLVGR